jgi:EmrB/QacA subfamily drug resistance transporter
MARKSWTLIAVCAATFMLLLDITVVNVALPYIARDLGSTFTDLQWVIDAYSLTLAALLLTGGSVADLLGRRAVFLVGLVIFMVASALCGLSGSPMVLNLSRGLQGIGGAFMFATGLALLAAAYPREERGTAIGIWGAVTGAAVAIGPLAGGVLIQAIGWQSIFFINLPIGVVTLYVTLRYVEESKNPAGGSIDYLGTVLFSLSLFGLLFGLIRGNPEGWSSPLILVMLIGAVVLMIAFVLVERSIAHPMFDLSLFRKPAFVGACVGAFALSSAMFGMILYIVLYLQNVLGYSALASGLRFTPVTILSFLVAPASGKLAERVGVRWFLGAGLGLIAVGLLLMSGLKVGGAWTALLAGFIVAGIGTGMVNPPLATAAIGVVQVARAGMASGINSTFRQVGVATGIAAWGAVFEHRVTTQFRADAAAAHVPLSPRLGSIADFVSFGGARATHNAGLIRIAEDAFLHGFNFILVLAAIVAAVGAVLCALLLRPQDFINTGSPEDVPAEAAAVGV